MHKIWQFITFAHSFCFPFLNFHNLFHFFFGLFSKLPLSFNRDFPSKDLVVDVTFHPLFHNWPLPPVANGVGIGIDIGLDQPPRSRLLLLLLCHYYLFFPFSSSLINLGGNIKGICTTHIKLKEQVLERPGVVEWSTPGLGVVCVREASHK